MEGRRDQHPIALVRDILQARGATHKLSPAPLGRHSALQQSQDSCNDKEDCNDGNERDAEGEVGRQSRQRDGIRVLPHVRAIGRGVIPRWSIIVEGGGTRCESIGWDAGNVEGDFGVATLRLRCRHGAI